MSHNKIILSTDEKEQLLQLYIKEKKSMLEVASSIGRSFSYVQRRLKILGVIRPKAESSELAKVKISRARTGRKFGPLTNAHKEAISKGHLRRTDTKGVLFNSKTGYIMVSRKNENRGRCYHTVIMEEHIGRKIRPNEVVHHKNDDKTDNRIKNLQLMTKSEHAKLHSGMRPRSANGKFIKKTS